MSAEKMGKKVMKMESKYERILSYEGPVFIKKIMIKRFLRWAYRGTETMKEHDVISENLEEIRMNYFYKKYGVRV